MSGERLAELLSGWEEEYKGGRDVPAEELCRDCPELLPDVREGIRELKDVARFGSGGSGVASAKESSRGGHPVDDATPFPVRGGGIAGYRLRRRLGAGGFGEVWSAESPAGEAVAIKFYRSQLEATRDGRRIDIETELSGLSRVWRVPHPHLLKVHGLPAPGEVVLVTELADDSLENHFRALRESRPLLPRCAYALFLLGGAADALDHLRDNYGLQHLDVKPANLLLVGRRCKVADFGTVSKVRPATLPQTGVVLSAPCPTDPEERTVVCYPSWREVPTGEAVRRNATLFTREHGAFTARYAPPEAFIGQFSRSSDQFSLCLTFCELVGKLPLGWDRGRGTPELEFLPEAIRPAIRRALSPRPEDRFGSCLAWVRATWEALYPVVPWGYEAGTRLRDWYPQPAGVSQAAGGDVGVPPGASGSGRGWPRHVETATAPAGKPARAGGALGGKVERPAGVPPALVSAVGAAADRGVGCPCPRPTGEELPRRGRGSAGGVGRLVRTPLAVAFAGCILAGKAGALVGRAALGRGAARKGDKPAGAKALFFCTALLALSSAPVLLAGWLVDSLLLVARSWRECWSRSVAGGRVLLLWLGLFAASYATGRLLGEWVKGLHPLPPKLGQRQKGQERASAPGGFPKPGLRAGFTSPTAAIREGRERRRQAEQRRRR